MADGNLTSALSARIRPIMGAIKSVPIPVHERAKLPETSPALPFITISREAGAGGRTLAARLLDRLGAREPADPPWAIWDREVVDKVAADLHISTQLIDSLERVGRNWLEQLLGGLSSHDVDDMAVFHRVAATIRALAQVGHAIIVGRGGVFITQHMPQGIHVRLLAPYEARVTRMMREDNLTREQAVRWIANMEAQREAFYGRYFPRQNLTPETFTVTINTAHVDDDRLADAVAALVARR